MSASFARTNRRRLEDLQAEVDRIVESDERFFERHRDRNHRLRLAGRAEVQMLEELHGFEPMRLPAGERWYCVVRQVHAGMGARLRVYCPNEDGIDTDVPERAAEWVFDRYAEPGGQVDHIEGVIRGVVERQRRGGA